MPETLSLIIGTSETLSAATLPENATYKGLTWSSSDESVATVDQSGKVTAVSIGNATITVYSADPSTTAACKVTVYQLAQSINLDQTELELYVGDDPVTLVATLLPDDASDKSVTWTSSNSSVATVDSDGKVTATAKGSATITAKTNDGSNLSAACMVMVTVKRNTNGREFVDLGLPSGILWASMNVGATKPEEYGDYFAWGETEPKAVYNVKFNKYCTKSNYWDGTGPMDNKTVLDLEDDVAHVNWGGSWRMPTEAEQDELRNNCTWTWTSQNGVKGRKVTGPNGNSIFLPAAGYRGDADLYDVGSVGDYWSSSLNAASPYRAWCVYFGSGGVYRIGDERYYGLSVRPVSE